MDNDVSAGSTTSLSVLGHLALGLTLLAFGLGNTGVLDGISVSDAAPLALYVGGIALFVTGLLEFRGGNSFGGTAFVALGAFWFTWGSSDKVSTDAAGVFLILWALLAFSLTMGAAKSGPLVQGTYGLLCVALLLLGVAQFADSEALAQIGGWFAALAGLVSWYGATAALAKWPTALPRRRAAGRGATATG